MQFLFIWEDVFYLDSFHEPLPPPPHPPLGAGRSKLPCPQEAALHVLGGCPMHSITKPICPQPLPLQENNFTVLKTL